MKNIAFIKLLVALAFSITTDSSLAQTPYDCFVSSGNKKEMLKSPEATFRAYNSDTTHKTKYIELDLEMYIISYFDEKGSLIKSVQLAPTDMKWYSVDQMAHEREWLTPYNFVQNNPINRIDPKGELDDWIKNSEGKIYWDDNATSQASTKKGEHYLGRAVVVFDGFKDEQLGKGQNLFGEGAKLANVTVYGPKGADDIQSYKGFTMTSDAETFGPIADGTFSLNYDTRGKSGMLKSNWAIEGRGEVPAYGGHNPNPNAYGGAYKTGIFIHTSNRNGYAGRYNNGKNGISEGCLLVVPTQYDNKGSATQNGFDQFNQQLQGVKQGTVIVTRR